MKNLVFVIAMAISLFAGCRGTYDVNRFSGEEDAYVFVRPQRFVCIGTESAADWLEIVSAKQELIASGGFQVDLSLRNKGGTGFFTWMGRSHDMTIYARVDFYDSENGNLIKSIPRQAIPLPLGDTVHFSQSCVDSRAKFVRVIMSER